MRTSPRFNAFRKKLSKFGVIAFAYDDRDLWVAYWINRGRRPKICAKGEVAIG